MTEFYRYRPTEPYLTQLKELLNRRSADMSVCRLWTGYVDKDGYGSYVARPPMGGKFTLQVHRLSYFLHSNWPALDPHIHVSHRCHSANGATTTYGKERILAKPRFVNQTQPIEDGPPNIKMEGNDRQQANKDNITRLTNLENTTSSANVVRTVEPQTSMFASAERLPK
ncbi:hypothetical protein Bbelb_110080 [Branchiostoma belcheri]|nr:hypothetical protein Bbelb_110080 [Branchiostoma belcheri]